MPITNLEFDVHREAIMKKLKNVTKKGLILANLYLLLMIGMQLASNYFFGKNLFVFFGMGAPILFSDPVIKAFGKHQKLYGFYMNIMVKSVFLAVAAGILLNSIVSDAQLKTIHYIAVGILVTVFIFSGKNVAYTFVGILGINILSAYFMKEAYPQFAIGFLAFFVFELLRGQKFHFSAFNEFKISLNFGTLQKSKQMAFIAIVLISGGFLLLNSTPHNTLTVYAAESEVK